MVPGQVIAADTVEFMRKLDVKEIHGYDATLGLKLIRPQALGAAKTERPKEARPPAKGGKVAGRAAE
jgi:arginine decarboxylase